MRLAVRVTPRGGRDAVDGWMRDADGRALLKVRVAAAAAEGRANAAVAELIARTLRRPRSAVRLVAGASGRVKLLEIDGVSEVDLAAAVGVPPA